LGWRDVGYESISRALGQDLRDKVGEDAVAYHALSRVSDDIVQFSSPIVYADEEEAVVQIGIMRLGSAVGCARASYHTKDGSAKDGQQYRSTSGELTFEPGEHEKVIDITLMQDAHWHATNEFKVHLNQPEGCELGRYLHFCRVKLLERNLFPAGKVAELGRGADLETMLKTSGPGLFWEYVKLNFRQPGMGWRTLLTIIMDQLPIALLLLQAWMTIYMVDVVFSVRDESSVHQLLFCETRSEEAGVLAVLFVLSSAAVQAWDCAKIKLDLKGHAIAFLRKNLVCRFLNYSEEARARVDSRRLEKAVMDDANRLAGGYIAALDTLRTLGTVAALNSFILYFNSGALWVAISMAALILAFLVLRMCICTSAPDSSLARMNLSRLISEMLKNYRLIVDFYRRPKINDMVADKVSKLQRTEVPEALASMFIESFVVWLGSLCLGLLIVLQAPVLLGERESSGSPLSLGAFLATIQVIRDMDRVHATLHSLCSTLMGTVDVVRDFTFLFNLKTDLGVWREVDAARRQLSTELGSIARRNAKSETELGIRSSKTKYAVDLMQILVKDVTFHYISSETVLRNASLCVHQGKLVALRGHHSSGKRTFLQILGHSIFPVSGSIFVPGHLRILQVSDCTMIFETWSAWDNLVFGLSEGGIDKERVRRILEFLGMTKTLKLVEDDLIISEGDLAPDPARCQSGLFAVEELPVDERSWHEGLSSTERSKMCLARALIANPEVLILHKPFLNYELEAKDLVKAAIVEHKQNRGISMPQDKVSQRRPRTCFYSVVDPRDADLADVVWQIDSSARSVSEVRSWPLGAAGSDFAASRKSIRSLLSS